MHFNLSALLFLSVVLTCTPPSAADALDGRALRCCTILEEPFVRSDDATDPVFAGLAIDVLQRLQSVLGFRCSSLREFSDVSGEPLTFSGAVAHMQACANATDAACTCDIGVGSWVLTEKRLGRADFVAPFAHDRYRFITHANNTKSTVDRVFVFTPFRKSVWTAVLILTSALFVLRLLEARFTARREVHAFAVQGGSNSAETACAEDDTAAERAGYMQRLADSLRYTGRYIFGVVKRKNAPAKQSWRESVLNALIFSVAFFLTVTYMAVMTNALTQERKRAKISSVRQFQDCAIPANEVCVTEGSGAQEYWQHAIASRSCHFRRDAPRVVTARTFDDTFRAFRNHQCNYLLGLGSDLQSLRRGAHCRTLRLAGAPFRDAGVSFILPPGSNLTAPFSAATLALRLRGALRSTQQTLEVRGFCTRERVVSVSTRKIYVFVIFQLCVCGAVLGLILCARWRALPKEPDDVMP